jgi:methylglutaconyl-CoA hydratase
MAAAETVLYELSDSLARITLNRPEKRNALNDELIEALKQALRRANDDDQVRAVVISGAGSDFCSGADLAALQKISTASVAENLADARSLMEVFTIIRSLRQRAAHHSGHFQPATGAVKGCGPEPDQAQSCGSPENRLR